MKPSSKARAVLCGALSTAMLSALGLSGCAAGLDADVSASTGGVCASSTASFTESDLRAVLGAVGLGSEADGIVDMFGSGELEGMEVVELADGTSAYTVSVDHDEVYGPDFVSPSRVVSYSDDATAASDGVAGELADMVYEELGVDAAEAVRILEALSDIPVRIDVAATFDRDIVDTSWHKVSDRSVSDSYEGTLGGLMLGGAANLDPAGYALFDSSVRSATDIAPSVAPGWTNARTVSFSTSGVVSSISSSTGPTQELSRSARILRSSGSPAATELTVTLLGGHTETFAYRYDGAKPKASVKPGKAYKAGKKIAFSDSASGVKSAKLDGKRVKSGAKVAKRGSHRLVVTDRAGNTLDVRFRVK